MESYISPTLQGFCPVYSVLRMTPAFTFSLSLWKRFLFFTIALLTSLPALRAQNTSLFSAPDTVCARQLIQVSTQQKASSYFWSFCPGTIRSAPTFRNLPNAFELAGPVAIEAAKDDNGRYYAFVLNHNNRTLVRLDFGTALSNTPVYTILPAYDSTVLPDSGGGLHLMRVGTDWHLFATAGSTNADATLVRLDFGNTLANDPTATDLGNPGGVLSHPKDLYITKEGNRYYGIILDAATSSLVRADFSAYINGVPTLQDLGNIAGMLRNPEHMTVSQINGLYKIYVTNPGNSSLNTVSFGTSLANTPTGVSSGNLFNNLFTPTGLSYYRDCDYPYLLIADATSNSTIRVKLDTSGNVTTDPTSVDQLVSAANDFSMPHGMTSFLRDSTTLYTFTVNKRNGSLTRTRFNPCTRASVAGSDLSTPSAFSYDTAGVYTINLILNEGKPDMKMGCRQIYVTPQPGLTLSNDTLICQGDTILLRAQSLSADSLRWSPAETLSDPTDQEPNAFPAATTRYRVVLNYPDGCVIDTGVVVRVVESEADAGPDRTLADGATTLLGGPRTSQGPEFSYLWTPGNYLDDSTKQFPVAQPFTNYTYYFTVIHTTPALTCSRTDSVVVRTVCNNITLPNAFAPESNIDGITQFGLLNKQLVKLISFSIFNRWGQEVYKSNDLTSGWDGTFNGKAAEKGVYVWRIDGFCPGGQRITQSGDVTLIR